MLPEKFTHGRLQSLIDRHDALAFAFFEPLMQPVAALRRLAQDLVRRDDDAHRHSAVEQLPERLNDVDRIRLMPSSNERARVKHVEVAHGSTKPLRLSTLTRRYAAASFAVILPASYASITPRINGMPYFTRRLL